MRVERVRATPALPGLVADDGVVALGVGRCGVPVGVSRPPVAGAFLTALAILLSPERYSTGSGTQKTARCGQNKVRRGVECCSLPENSLRAVLARRCLRNNGKTAVFGGSMQRIFAWPTATLMAPCPVAPQVLQQQGKRVLQDKGVPCPIRSDAVQPLSPAQRRPFSPGMVAEGCVSFVRQTKRPHRVCLERIRKGAQINPQHTFSLRSVTRNQLMYSLCLLPRLGRMENMQRGVGCS